MNEHYFQPDLLHLFIQPKKVLKANVIHSCHGGPQWTTPPSIHTLSLEAWAGSCDLLCLMEHQQAWCRWRPDKHLSPGAPGGEAKIADVVADMTKPIGRFWEVLLVSSQGSCWTWDLLSLGFPGTTLLSSRSSADWILPLSASSFRLSVRNSDKQEQQKHKHFVPVSVTNSACLT